MTTSPRAFTIGIALFAFSIACDRPATDEATTSIESPVTGERIDIARDDTGTAHIYARSTEAAMYGLGYAQAQDRLFQMNYRRLAMYGRLAEHFAVDEAAATSAQDRTARRAFNNKLIDKDILVRRIGYARIARDKVNRLGGDTPRLLNAFAAGVNAYLASEDFELSEAFRSAGITRVDRWRPEDSLLVWDWVGRRAARRPQHGWVTIRSSSTALSCDSTSRRVRSSTDVRIHAWTFANRDSPARPEPLNQSPGIGPKCPTNTR